MFFHKSLIVSAILCSTVAGQAQSTASAASTTNAARATRDTIATLNRLESFTPEPDFARPSPGDADLGEQLILLEKNQYRSLNLSGGYSTTWTSNAFYTPSNPSSDVIMGLYADAIFLPHLGANWYFEGGAAIRGFRYFRNPVLDFNAVEATTGLLKIFPEIWDIGVYGRYEYDMLWYPGGSEILHEHTLAVGARKTWSLSRAQTLFFSFEADFSLGGYPDYAMAHEFTFFASHQVQWTRWFYSSLYYQMAIFDFRYVDRADLRNYLGIVAGVQPFKWLNVSASSWLGWNASDDSFYDFFVANAGGAITATINF